MIITAIVLWVVALCFILITVKNIIIRTIKIRCCTAMVNGVISDVKEKVIRREGIISKEYIPTVSYTVDGVEYSKQLAKAYHADTYAIGQTVEIMVNPQKPSEINKKGKSNKADVVMLCIGVLIGIVGIGLLTVK